jgi:hypothetical protein
MRRGLRAVLLPGSGNDPERVLRTEHRPEEPRLLINVFCDLADRDSSPRLSPPPMPEVDFWPSIAPGLSVCASKSLIPVRLLRG